MTYWLIHPVWTTAPDCWWERFARHGRVRPSLNRSNRNVAAVGSLRTDEVVDPGTHQTVEQIISKLREGEKLQGQGIAIPKAAN
jgi:hypothetical protein